MEDDPWAPLAVMFAMYGSRITSKLLFKYPYSNRMQHYKQLTGSTYHLNNSTSSGLYTKNTKNPSLPGANDSGFSDSDDDGNDDGWDEKIRDEAKQLKDFSEETLGHILAPHNNKICGRKFDLKINGLRFVGFPLMLEQSNLDHNRPYKAQFETPIKLGNDDSDSALTHSKNDQINVLSYNVVFVLNTTAKYSVIESFQQLASKIGLGLRFEEKRASYLTNQARILLNIHEAESEESPEARDQVYRKILHQSSLAKFFRDVFKAVHETGIVEHSLNNYLRISYCSFNKVHESNANDKHRNSSKNATDVERVLHDIQPYHGILVYDMKDVSQSLKPFASSSIRVFLQIYNPTKSLQFIASEADMALNHVYAIVRHLVSWGKACIIYPLCESNIYMIAPTAVLDKSSHFVDEFSEKFGENLQYVLSHFSIPVRLGDLYTPNGMFYESQPKLIDIVFWLLRHRFLVQHHTYVHFLPSPLLGVRTHDLLPMKQYLIDLSDQCGNDSRITLLEIPEHCLVFFRSIEAAKNSKDLSCFLKLLKYFDGKHHLEEMMYRENIPRLELLNILDKFNPLLMTFAREDEISSHKLS